MNDLISRQAAIDALAEQIALCDKALNTFGISMKDEYAVKVEKASLVAYKEQLESIPSAQPEIIRCEDCKHVRKWRTEESAKKFGQVYECARGVLSYPKSDDFCSKAEGRER